MRDIALMAGLYMASAPPQAVSPDVTANFRYHGAKTPIYLPGWRGY